MWNRHQAHLSTSSCQAGMHSYEVHSICLSPWCAKVGIPGCPPACEDGYIEEMLASEALEKVEAHVQEKKLRSCRD